ncbi:hypothetical protein QBC46DRAFT_453761 [Diplogelasinospora grovesii]|uniref:BZIP domain-containing protein n=1 Tax=Diplogelasinospora grovesii TaxID=303347 RepID=A0AAN6MX08_9PEZI|nr:hypothetical protein QBC46DRAFT_453761 [Diplogelasinospora grovesii]
MTKQNARSSLPRLGQIGSSGSDDWANVQDLRERRKIQNRNAQRNYQELERLARGTSSSESTPQQQTPTSNLPDDQETSSSSESTYQQQMPTTSLPDGQETSSSSESTHQQQMLATNLTPIAPGPTLQTAPIADMIPLKSNLLSETGSADYFSFQPSATPGLGSIPDEARLFQYHQYSIPVCYVQPQSGYTSPVGMPSSYHSPPQYMGVQYQGPILPKITTLSDIPGTDEALYTDFSFESRDPSGHCFFQKQ